MRVEDFEELVRRTVVKSCMPGDFRFYPDETKNPFRNFILRARIGVLHRTTNEQTKVQQDFLITATRIESMSEEDAICWLFTRMRTVWLHELEECFLVGGHRVYDPHR